MSTPVTLRGRLTRTRELEVIVAERATTDEGFLRRFWTKVNKNGPIPAHCPELGPCWEWTRSRTPRGYGKFGITHCEALATHRVAWMLAHGLVPDDLWVLHRCDNPACVRIEHLFLGTAKDNTQDMYSKGRNRHNPLLGEDNPGSKLTATTVQALRERFHAGEHRLSLAAEYEIDEATASYVFSGKRWQDAPGPVNPHPPAGRRPGGDQEGVTHVCVACGRRRKNQGRGLCGRCHEANRIAGTLDNYPLVRRQQRNSQKVA